jgi:hypothetical protein
MYEVVHYIPTGEARYWTGSSFSFNPFNALKMSDQDAYYVFLDLIEKGYSREDVKVVQA